MKHVYVVTSVELGWDCVVGVFDSSVVSREDLEKAYPSKHGYVIHSNKVETEIEAD
jgi:hypothetical protein